MVTNSRNGNHHANRQQSAFDRIGCLVSSFVADIAATPIAQILVILVCAAWFLGGFATDLLTAILSIMAITLTQMVLNQQKERETDAHRRDVAMHAKLDELLVAVRGARNEMAGIEELDEEDIENLKVDAKQVIDEAGQAAGDAKDRAVAKRAVDEAVSRATETAGPKRRSSGAKR
jgi:low affinity Fe/Cu permease